MRISMLRWLELGLIQRLRYGVNWRPTQGRRLGVGKKDENTRTYWAQGGSWEILEGDLCFQSRAYHCSESSPKVLPCFLLSVFNILGLSPWKMCAHNHHQTNTTGHAQLASKVCVNKSNPALGDPRTHLQKAMPRPPFPDSGLNTNVRKTDWSKMPWPL